MSTDFSDEKTNEMAYSIRDYDEEERRGRIVKEKDLGTRKKRKLEFSESAY